jgi:hypothetical protein
MTLMPVSKIFRLGLEVDEVGALAVNRPAQRVLRDVGAVVDRLAEHVEDAAERGRADRHRDGGAGVDHVHATHHTVGAGHGDGAHLIAADVLLHFGGHAHLRPSGAVVSILSAL